MRFQKVVLSICIIILVISLTSLAIMLRNSKEKYAHPPLNNKCPNEYELKGSRCVSPTGTVLTIDGRTNVDFINKLDLKTKKKYANDNNILWDGVTDAVLDDDEEDDEYSGIFSGKIKIERKHTIIILLIIFSFMYFLYF